MREERERKQAEEARLRREAEYAKMMAEYQRKETDKAEPLQIPPMDLDLVMEEKEEKPMVTVTSDEGLSHSYPQRDFKPEKPKTEETVTLKTSGEIHDGTGRLADKAVLAGMGLAMTASMVLMMTRKFRSPIAAPEAGVALTSRVTGDLEDPEPIAGAGVALTS